MAALRCGALTASGTRCSRTVREDGLCTQHIKQQKAGRLKLFDDVTAVDNGSAAAPPAAAATTTIVPSAVSWVPSAPMTLTLEEAIDLENFVNPPKHEYEKVPNDGGVLQLFLGDQPDSPGPSGKRY